MPQRFVPFDEGVIVKELKALAKSDAKSAAKLGYCIERVENEGLDGDHGPAKIQDFGNGLKELRHDSGTYKGRAFFYEAEGPAGIGDLVILRVFRKETAKTPLREIETAEERMKNDRKRRTLEAQATNDDHAPDSDLAQAPDTDPEQTP